MYSPMSEASETLSITPITEQPASDVKPESDVARVNLIFTGSGAEYFRIWAINLTLTICTLGLYGAWAKVRRLQYFYQHTLLDGSAFDYTANPVSILFGRVLALGLLVVYYLAFEYSAHAGLAVTLSLAAVLPYLLWQSNRFKARNTRLRGLEFGFEGSLRDAYRVYMPVIVIAFGPSAAAAYLLGPKGDYWVLLLSALGMLMFPIFHAVFRRYVQSNLRFGNARFVFTAKSADFARVWGWSLGAMLLLVLLAGLLSFAIVAIGAVILGKGRTAPWMGVTLTLAMAWLIFALMGSYLTARFQRLVWDKTAVGDVALHCVVSARRFMRIQCMNTLWVILSLGLYRPFAAIRLTKFRLECVSASGLERLDTVAAGAGQSRRGALGESAAELFDMDVGL
jgi:uncharacterized membrane protein YjgN (DUF898 family)